MIKAIITIKFHSLEVLASSGFFCFPNNPSKKMPELQKMRQSWATMSIMAIFTLLANDVNVEFLFIPANTKAVPTHCLRTRLLPKKMTEAKTVKNFLKTIMNN